MISDEYLCVCSTGNATVQLQSGPYTVAEGEIIPICAQLTLPPGATALGCEITATFSGTGGTNSGLLIIECGGKYTDYFSYSD